MQITTIELLADDGAEISVGADIESGKVYFQVTDAEDSALVVLTLDEVRAVLNTLGLIAAGVATAVQLRIS